jgi:putative MATE family efflux protein
VHKTDGIKPLLSIALPIMVQTLVAHLQIVIDRAFLGNINSLYLSALGNVMVPYNAVSFFLVSAATGLTILIAQSLGAHRNDRARGYAESSLFFSTLLGLGLFLFWQLAGAWIFRLLGAGGLVHDAATRYLRLLSLSLIVFGFEISSGSILQGAGITRPIMYAAVIKSGLNILLDWLLIFGNLGFPELGLEGAALATSIANSIGALSLFFFLFSSGLPFRISRRSLFSPRWVDYWASMKIGLPAGIESLLWFGGQTVMVRIFNSISSRAMGIATLVQGIQIMAVLIYLGFARGTTTLVGRYLGQGRIKQAMRTGFLAQKIALGVSATAGLVFLIFAPRLVDIFTNDPAVIRSGSRVLRIAAFTIQGQAVNMVIGSAIRGTGDTRWMLRTQVFGTFFVLASASLLVFVFGMGIVGIYLTILFDEYIRAAINFLRFIRGGNPFVRGNSAARWRDTTRRIRREQLNQAVAGHES